MAQAADEAAARRLEAALALLSLRANSRDIRDWLPEKVVVVLDEDPIVATLEYLEFHYPEGAYLVRVDGESHVEAMEVRQPDGRSATQGGLIHEMPIHPDTEIGMLFSYLRTFPGKRLHGVVMRTHYEVMISLYGD